MAPWVSTAILRPPAYDERLLLLGSTKAGKTEAGRQLLHQGGYERFNVLDWKGDVHLLDDHLIVHEPPWEHPRAWSEDRVLYRPVGAEYRTAESMDRVLRWLFERQQALYDQRRERPGPPRIVWVDEAFRLGKAGRTAALSDCATSGRALGLGLWVGSQRPRWIPVEVRTEAELWLVFFLTYLEDQKEVIRYSQGHLTLPQLQAGWKRHGFLELRREVDRHDELQVNVRQFPRLRLPEHGGQM